MHSIPSNFWQWLSSLDSDTLGGVIAAITISSLVAIAFCCTAVYKIHKTRVEDSLKRELLDRGMSAEEIATIISAKPDNAHGQRTRRL